MNRLSTDFEALGDEALREAVLQVVRGVRPAPRTNGIQLRAICKLLPATPKAAVRTALAALVEEGKLRSTGGYFFFR